MRIVEEKITYKNDGKLEKLSDRRPDLEKIELTCDNTKDTVPYTQIVNEVLAEKLKKELCCDKIKAQGGECKEENNEFKKCIEKKLG